MSTREDLLKRIASYDFAIVELNLFLDSHPHDGAALAKLKEYVEKSKTLRREFEENFGPLKARSTEGNRWMWISNPWPWDTVKEGEK